MSKKYLYFIIIPIIVILLAIFLFLVFKIKNAYYNSKKNSQTINTQVSMIASSTEETNTKNSPFDLAKKNKDFNECLKVDSKEYQDGCLFLVASYLQDENACLKLNDLTQVEKCKEGVLWEKAVKNNQLSLCSQIADEVLDQSCIANSLGNNPNAKKEDCTSLSEKEKTYCENYFSMITDRQIFKDSKSASDCQKISDQLIKEECLGMYP